MTEKQPTIYDVAAAAGVSIATVSRVLSGGSASAAAKERVNAAIAALSYAPSPARRTGPREKKALSPALALVVSNLTNPYYASLCAGAEAEAQRNGYALQLYSHDLNESISPGLLRQIMSHHPLGAVMVGSMVENGSEDEIRIALQQLRAQMPLVVIGPPVPDLDCINITSDLSVSVRKSLTHLVSLGHRRIALVGGSSSIRSASTREAAFYQEMERRGLPALREGNDSGFTPQAGELGVSKLFSLPMQSRPTALIAINDLVALGALRQLQRMGLRVPEDVSLIGCDNQFFTPFLNPPLTTVDLHPADHGRNAVAELISAINGSSTHPFSQIRECSLIMRESCGPVSPGG